MNSTNRSGAGASPRIATGASVSSSLGSIAAGLVRRPLLVLVVFAGGTSRRSPEARCWLWEPASRCWPARPGAADRVASGLGARSGRRCLDGRRTRRPAPRARRRGARTRRLDLAGAARSCSSASSFRGARRSLDHWSRRCPALPGARRASLIVRRAARTRSSPQRRSNLRRRRAGHVYRVNGQHLYLNCSGSGSPTVVLFNGLGESTTNWAWVQRTCRRPTRVCVFDRPGAGLERRRASAPGRSRARVELARATARSACLAAVRARRALRRRRLRARLRRRTTRTHVAGRRADRLGDAGSVRASGLSARSTARSSAPRRSCQWPHARSWGGLPCGAGSVLCRRVRATRTRLQLVAAPAGSESARAPAAADRLQSGESRPKPHGNRSSS